MGKIYIYTLKSPLEDTVFYVGKTNNLDTRFYAHMTDIHTGGQSAKVRWIKELLKNNLWPIMDVIEVCDDTNYIEREKYWIRHFCLLNPDLKNTKYKKRFCTSI